MQSLKITILVDDSSSWIVPYAERLCEELSALYQVILVFDQRKVPGGDILFLLGCTKMVKPETLGRNKNNVVVHESELPKGRGWSPMAWQVLEGKNTIPVVLFEAAEELDAGEIYLRDYIDLDGTELLPEIRRKQGDKTISLILEFLEKWPDIKGEPQKGEPTYYPKRTEKDDALDTEKSIIENFNHLRIVDNEEYPAWFKHKGQKYILKIHKAK